MIYNAQSSDCVRSDALDFDARECLVCSVQPVMESRHTDWVSLCLILLFLLHLSSSFSLFFSFFNLLLILFLHLLFLSSLPYSHFILFSSCPPSLPLQSTFTLFPTHFSLPSLISLLHLLVVFLFLLIFLLLAFSSLSAAYLFKLLLSAAASLIFTRINDNTTSPAIQAATWQQNQGLLFIC